MAENNKKEMSNKEFAIGCLGLIVVLGLVLFLFMGCMAKMTENNEPTKQEKTDKRLKEKAEKTEKKQEKDKSQTKKEKNVDKSMIKEFDGVMKRKMDSNSKIGQYVNSYKIEDADSNLPIIKIIVDNSVKYNEDYKKQEIADSIGHEVQSASRSTFIDDNPFIRIDYQNGQVFAESKTLSVNEFKVKN